MSFPTLDEDTLNQFHADLFEQKANQKAADAFDTWATGLVTSRASELGYAPPAAGQAPAIPGAQPMSPGGPTGVGAAASGEPPSAPGAGIGGSATPPAPVAPASPAPEQTPPTAAPSPAPAQAPGVAVDPTLSAPLKPFTPPASEYVDYARQAAQRAGIDPEVFVRQINAESGFNPNAVSGAGAQGIAQIVPKYHPGVNPLNPKEALDYAANLMARLTQQYGSLDRALVAYNGGGGAVAKYDAGQPYAESQHYLANILGGGGGPNPSSPAGTPAAPGSGGFNQFNLGLSAADAYAFCGPAAALSFAAVYGRNPSPSEAKQLAQSVGWTSDSGMAGIDSEAKLIQSMGVPVKVVRGADWGAFAQEAMSGNPVTISTDGHYFFADGYDPKTGKFHVGGSGQALSGGSEWMSPQEMTSRMGAVQGALFADHNLVDTPSQNAAQSPLQALKDTAGLAAQGVGNAAQGFQQKANEVKANAFDFLSSLTAPAESLVRGAADAVGGAASLASQVGSNVNPNLPAPVGGFLAAGQTYLQNNPQGSRPDFPSPAADFSAGIGAQNQAIEAANPFKGSPVPGVEGAYNTALETATNPMSYAPVVGIGSGAASFIGATAGGRLAEEGAKALGGDQTAQTVAGLAGGLPGAFAGHAIGQGLPALMHGADRLGSAFQDAARESAVAAEARAGFVTGADLQDFVARRFGSVTPENAHLADWIGTDGSLIGDSRNADHQLSALEAYRQSGASIGEDAAPRRFMEDSGALRVNLIGGELNLEARTRPTPQQEAAIARIVQENPRVRVVYDTPGDGGFGLDEFLASADRLPPPRPAPATSAPSRVEKLGNPQARQLANEYVQTNGIAEGVTSHGYVQNDVPTQKAIADFYHEAVSAPEDPAVQRAYGALAKEVEQQYDFLTGKGITFEPYYKGDPNPYPTSADMMADARNGHLYVYADDLSHPLLTDEQNWKFRAVHDYFGHSQEGFQFGPRGEENAWLEHLKMFSPDARKALTTETRGQNSWVNYGPFGDANRADPANTTFAEQKAIILPDQFLGRADVPGAEPPAPIPPPAASTPRGPVSTAQVLKMERQRAAAIARARGETGEPVLAGKVAEYRETVPPPSSDDLEAAQATLDALPSPLAGVPNSVQDAESLAALRRDMRGLANAGRGGAVWYDESSQGVLDLVGGDKDEAEKLVQLLAIYSAKTPVPDNANRALTAWYQWKAGVPIDAPGFGWQNKAASKLLYDGEAWGGRKTNNFYRNLMKRIDPEKSAEMGVGGETGVTVDVWMMRAFGFKNEAPTTRQYDFVQAETERIAKELGWTPDQAQAAIWTAAKAGWEGSDLKAAAYNYRNALEDRFAQVSWETSPGSTPYQDVPGWRQAPMEQKLDYHAEVGQAFLDERGRDTVAREFGLVGGGSFDAPGVWEGQVTPGGQTQISLPAARKSRAGAVIEGAGGKIDAASRIAVRAYAAARGLLLRQDAVGWTRVLPVADEAEASAVGVDIGRAFWPDEAAAVDTALGKSLGSGQHAIVSTPRGAWVLYTGGESAGEAYPPTFKAAVADALNGSLRGVEEAKITSVRHDGELLFNDWEANRNGEDYRNVIQGAGLADRFARVEPALSARIREAQARVAERYGWPTDLGTPSPGTQRAAGQVGYGTTLGGAAGGAGIGYATGEDDPNDPNARLKRAATGAVIGGAAGALAGAIPSVASAPLRRAIPQSRGILPGTRPDVPVEPLPGGTWPPERPTSAMQPAFDVPGMETPPAPERAIQPSLPLPDQPTPPQRVTPGQVINTYRYANMLSGWYTQIGNVFSNLGQTGAAPVHLLAEVRPVEAVQYLGGTIGSVPDAVKGALRVLTEGVNPRTATHTTVGAATAPSGFLGPKNPLQWPTNLLSAADEFFYTINREGALRARAWREAGGDQEKFAAILQNPAKRPGLLEYADNAARRATYTEDPIGPVKKLQEMRNDGSIWGTALGFLVPFVRTPFNITGRGVGMATGNVLGDVRAAMNYLAKRGTAEEAAAGTRLREEAGKTVVAGMVWYGLASLALQGRLSGAGPKDAASRNVLETQGWKPQSVKIGDTWVPYSQLGPLGVHAGVVANAFEAILDQSGPNAKKARDLNTIAGDAWERVKASVVDDSPLRGLGGIFSDRQPDPTGFAAQQVSGFIPASGFLRNLARSTDPYARQPADRSDLAARLATNIPGLSQTVTPNIDAYGKPIPSPNFGNPQPFAGTPERPDPLMDLFKGANVGITNAPATVTVGRGQSIQLTPDERRQYEVFRGEALQRAGASLGNDRAFKTAPKEVQAKVLNQILDQAAEEARGRLLSRLGDQTIGTRVESLRTALAR